MIGLFKRLFRRSTPMIGDATTRDTAALADLHARSFQRGWSESEFETLLAEANTLAHNARVGRSVVGFIISRMAAGEAEILSVAVADSQRHRGVGTMLLRHHLGSLMGIGVRAVFLEVDEINGPALRLYRRAGFIEVARRPGYYPQNGGRQTAALVMRRDLD